MKRTKRMIVGVIVLALLMSFSILVPAYAAEDFTVHAKAPSTWTEPGLWAWSAPDGTNVFTAWPGEKLTKDDNNEGWFYYSVPSWTNSVIINEGVDGGGQTADVSIESKELWITVADDFATSVVYEAPEGFLVTVAEEVATEEVATEEVTTAEVPKTGDASMIYLWFGFAALSGIGYMVIRRKKVESFQ
jgi:LPXTG-motif cell wall-anchored protein